MDKELTIVVLAALLHDIGKFAQRAGRPYSKELTGEYLTNYKGRQGHWHTVYTDYFIENDLPLPADLENDRSRIARLASVHHRPAEGSMAEMTLMIADRLSSGTDRISHEDEEGQAGFRESRLISVFDEVQLVRHKFDPPGHWFHGLVTLEPGSKKIFPLRGVHKGKAGEYEELFAEFHTELQTLKEINRPDLFLEALTSLLEKYTWCIPSSSYKTLPDISLFDHSFSTASIAQALFLYHRSKESAPTWMDDETKFILVGGNLSGIQKYIFGITRNSGKGVSKIFRARSFYLQALIRAALIDIQRTTGLLGACRLLDSGGKFILLLPDTEDIRRKIEQFDRELQIWFRDKFKGTVTLSLSWHTRLKHQDFMLESFRFQIDRLNETLEAVKYQKLCKTFSEQGMVIEEGYEQTEAGNCTLCGINSADPESIKHYSQKTESEIAICRDCSDQILYFGSKLPRTRYLVYGTTEKAPVYRDIRITLSADPPPVIDNDILHVEALVDKPGFGRYRLARHLPTLLENDLADENWFRVFEQDLDFERTDGQSVPMTFNMIAHKSKKRIPDKLVGRSLLGFMKADVDNLGLIFGLGLGDRLSVARFTMMSRMLHIFFSEYLVELLKKEFPYIYVVFAGGDDLFLVGPWWQTVDFAITLREHFSMFCAENPDITLSCGLLPARPRLPMKRAVELVETYLENAKSHDSRSRRKDSICFMGETVSWVEMKELMALGRQFDQAVEQKSRTKFSTAFLYRLMEYHKMYRRFIEGGEIKSGRYLSLAHYDIGRNIISGNKDNQAELDMLFRIFSVGVDERPELNRLNIPLFYAINMNRES